MQGGNRGAKDDEGPREGRQGIGALRSTRETGEPFPTGPRGGKGASDQDAVGGTHAEHFGV